MARPTDGAAPGAPAVEEFLGPMFWSEDSVLLGIVDHLRREDVPIHVGADSGRLLQLLCTVTGARRVLEIGTLAGYSAIWMARGLGADGTVDTIEIDPGRASRARANAAAAGVGPQVNVLEGAALEALPGLDGPYDLAFMDAVKCEYPAYLDHLLRLVRPGGVICADNVIWGGKVADPGVTDADTDGLRTYLRRVASEPRLRSTVVPTGDGLAISVILPG